MLRSYAKGSRTVLLLIASGVAVAAQAGVITTTEPRPTPPISTPGSAAPAQPAWPDAGIYDQHSYNRALAFGSVLIANGGVDVHTWKDITPTQICWVSSGASSGTSTNASAGRSTAPASSTGPVRAPGSPATPAQPADPGRTSPPDSGRTTVDPLTCWNTMVTLSYSLSECPDGRAFLLRQGVGVQFTDLATGTLVNWQETANCDGSPVPMLTAVDTQDAHRPLDLQHMVIESR